MKLYIIPSCLHEHFCFLMKKKEQLTTTQSDMLILGEKGRDRKGKYPKQNKEEGR